MKKFLVSILIISSQLLTWAQNRMTPELLWDLKRLSNIQLSPDKTNIMFSIKTYDLKANSGINELYVMPLEGGEPQKISNFDQSIWDAQWRPDGKKIGFIKNGKGGSNIFEMNPDGSDVTPISAIKGGVNGFKYSPDGTKVLFIKDVKIENVHSTEIYSDLPQSNAKVYTDLMYRHWSTYKDGTYSHLFFAVIQNGKIQGDGVDVMRNEPYDAPLKPFGGMEQISWSADSKSIFYTSKKLVGKAYAVSTNSQIYQYDLYKQTTTEISKKMEGYDMNPTVSPDGTKLAWLSMMTPGYESDKNVIVVMDLKSGNKKYVTESIDLTVNDFVWGRDNNTLYFIADIEGTKQWFEFDIKKDKNRQLTTGDHNLTSIAFAGDQLIGGLQSMNHPTDIYSYSLKSKKLNQLTDVNKAIYDQLNVGKIEKRWVKTTDNKKELVWVIYPPDFDENKVYPALLYCQGGPQSAVSQFFSYRWNFQLMAANDYIVIAPNRRGLPGFGQSWNDEIAKDWGGQAIQDYLSAVDEIKKEPYIDENRIGAVGASYGGYSVYYLAGVHQNRFACFISHCGLYNLKSWYGTTEELFFANHDIGGPYYSLDVPKEGFQQVNTKESEDFYKKNSPNTYAANWNTPMLIFQGEKDYRVPMGQGLEAFQALQVNNIESKLVLFPDENHWVLSPQNGVFWHRQYYSWLDHYLK